MIDVSVQTAPVFDNDGCWRRRDGGSYFAATAVAVAVVVVIVFGHFSMG